MNWKPPLCSLLLVLLLVAGTAGDEFAAANRLFDAGDYAASAAAYEALTPKTAHIYYNLGNAYYRQEQLGRALLNYERARQLAPRDPDILANRQFAQEQLGVGELNMPPRLLPRFWQTVLAGRTLRE